MANYTENYQLEKPLPEEFYDVGVQNGNMDKIDAAIAAIDGAKAGEKGDLADDDALPLVDSADSSKTKRVLWSTVKAALAKLFVPLTRKINGKALREDLTLTGEDIKVSGSDETSISSSLSNKLNASNFIPITGDTDLHTLNAGVYILGSGANVTVEKNWPYTGCFFGFVVVFRNKNIFPDDHGAIICISESTNEVYRQTHAYETWSKWKEESTATPPQENDMLLENGFTALQPCTWRKNQFGEVNLGGCVSGNISDGVLVATMPVGCRPNRIVERPATFQSLDSGYTRYAGSVMISPDGNVVFHITGTANYGIFSADYATS